MDELSKSFATAYSAVSAAPWVFLSALGLSAIAIWRTINWAYSTRLANLKSTIEALEKRVSQRAADTAIAIEAGNREHSQRKEPAPTLNRIFGIPAVAAADGKPAYVPDAFTPEVALATLDGRTSLQAAAALAPYIGQRMIVEREIRQVSDVGNEISIALESVGVRSIYCYFANDDSDLRQLSIGDRIRIDGKIESIAPLGIELTDCVRQPLREPR